jgi:DNA-binding NarL/FixJ family response regulator
LRDHAVRLYADGLNLRRIARHLGVVHQTVANGVAAHADALPVNGHVNWVSGGLDTAGEVGKDVVG